MASTMKYDNIEATAKPRRYVAKKIRGFVDRELSIHVNEQNREETWMNDDH